MDIRVLRYFMAVAKEENISKAAANLYISQPTLSRQMMGLEEELGVQLFTRNGKISLTEAGEHLRNKALEVISLMDRLEQDFLMPEDVTGTLSIGSGIYQAGIDVFHTLREFSRRYPKVIYDIHTSTADKLKEMLDKGLLDFAVLQEPIDVGKYAYLHLKSKDRWGVLMRADDKLAQHAQITLEQLNRLKLLVASREALLHDIDSRLGDKVQLNIIGYHSLITNSLPLIEDGAAYGLTIEGACHYLNPSLFRFVPLLPELSTSVLLVWKKYNSTFGVAEAFLSFIKEQGLREE